MNDKPKRWTWEDLVNCKDNEDGDHSCYMLDRDYIFNVNQPYINALEARLAIAVDALDFYASESNWQKRSDGHTQIKVLDKIIDKGKSIGGKTAREALKKIKEME